MKQAIALILSLLITSCVLSKSSFNGTIETQDPATDTLKKIQTTKGRQVLIAIAGSKAATNKELVIKKVKQDQYTITMGTSETAEAGDLAEVLHSLGILADKLSQITTGLGPLSEFLRSLQPKEE